MTPEVLMKIIKSVFATALFAGTLSACGTSAKMSPRAPIVGPPPNVEAYDYWDNPEQFTARVTFGNVKADALNELFKKCGQSGLELPPWR